MEWGWEGGQPEVHRGVGKTAAQLIPALNPPHHFHPLHPIPHPPSSHNHRTVQTIVSPKFSSSQAQVPTLARQEGHPICLVASLLSPRQSFPF